MTNPPDNSASGPPPQGTPSGNRSRLGQILIENGAVSQAQLDHALSQQPTLKMPLGKVLLKLGYVSDETMRQALSLQLNVPYLDLEKVSIDRTLARVVNRNYAKRHSIVPVAKVGRTLTVAMDDPTARNVVDELSRLTNYSITVVTASGEAIQRSFRMLYEEAPEGGGPTGADGRPTPVLAPTPTLAAVAAAEKATSVFGADEGVAKRADELFKQLITKAIDESCSDIHLETMPGGLYVRFRIDGVLRMPPFPTLQRALDAGKREVISRIKILAKMDIAERRRPQDGSFQATIMRDGAPMNVDMRVSIIPTYYGESVVIRILDRTRAPRAIRELDLAPEVADRLEVLLERPTGIFLVTGPTGSGKSTTLGACLNRLHRPDVRILTAEDPVEYVYNALSQSEVNEDIGNTFSAYLRAFLRHDPEVIMVGEIRDEDTAEMAFRAAQTGHLLLSTLHTNSAIAALPRLLDLKIEPSLISSSLIAVMSQRLIRKICTQCRQEAQPSMELLAAFFERVPEDMVFYEGAGCAACGNTGYRGRMIVADLWVPDEQDLVLIARHAPYDEVRQSAIRTTFSMAEDSHARLRAGRTTMAEMLRMLPHSVVAEHRVRFSAPAPARMAPPVPHHHDHQHHQQ